MAQNYYQKEIETMPASEMKKLQSEKWFIWSASCQEALLANCFPLN